MYNLKQLVLIFRPVENNSIGENITICKSRGLNSKFPIFSH